jgi:RTX calcium-binding nonapeptide repeat (4 copies)
MKRTMLLLATVTLSLLVASGIALAVNKIGTDHRDFLKGTDGADNLVGKGDSDRIFGLAGKDNLIGGPGKDMVVGGNEHLFPSGGDKSLLGGPGNDVVLGGKGSDSIFGNEGNDFVGNGPNRSADRIFAGGGNDVVGAVNAPASRDVVVCGDGFDRVFADTRDTIAPDCEKVADSGSEFEQLGNSIPQSFWDGLPAPWGLDQYPSQPSDYARATGLAKAFERANVNPLVGDWRRKRTCEEYVSRLRQAGLEDQIPSHQELLAEFGAGDAQGGQGPCRGVNGRLAHDHVFYRDGRFASVDNTGRFVDNDHYILPNDHTIVFPGSGSETVPPVTAHFRFSDHLNTVTFDLVLPKNLDQCSDRCRGDYAWAISVFFSGLHWHRVCQADDRDNNVNGRVDELGEPCWIS